MARARKEGQASQRQLRVGELVRHAVAELLSRGEVADPDLEGAFITVPEVRMTPDLRQALVLVAPLGMSAATDKAKGETLVAALERNNRFLRGQVARRVNLKYAPELRFKIDTRFEDDMRIERLLHSPEVERDLGPPSSDAESSPSADTPRGPTGN